jgi:hypothetical protein
MIAPGARRSRRLTIAAALCASVFLHHPPATLAEAGPAPSQPSSAPPASPAADSPVTPPAAHPPQPTSSDPPKPAQPPVESTAPHAPEDPAQNPAEKPSESPAPATAPAEAPPLARNLETLPPTGAAGILGVKVSGPNAENMGLMVDVIVGDDGNPRAAVIDFGGFLGVGSRKIAVDWRLLKFLPGDAKTPIVLSLDRAALKAAPEYKPGSQPIVIVGQAPQGSSDGGK